MPDAIHLMQIRLAPGDTVRFACRNTILEGSVVRTNPKRAVVNVVQTVYAVPYARLTAADPAAARERERRVDAARNCAETLMHQHGLAHWRFAFDLSARRAGCCNYRDRTLTLSLPLAQSGNEAAIRDTILHEIAHALVGKRHGHGPVWKAKALEIGSTGERTHRLELAPPRYLVACVNQCWEKPAHRRNNRLVCRACGGALVWSRT